MYLYATCIILCIQFPILTMCMTYCEKKVMLSCVPVSYYLMSGTVVCLQCSWPGRMSSVISWVPTRALRIVERCTTPSWLMTRVLYSLFWRQVSTKYAGIYSAAPNSQPFILKSPWFLEHQTGLWCTCKSTFWCSNSLTWNRGTTVCVYTQKSIPRDELLIATDSCTTVYTSNCPPELNHTKTLSFHRPLQSGISFALRNNILVVSTKTGDPSQARLNSSHRGH